MDIMDLGLLLAVMIEHVHRLSTSGSDQFYPLGKLVDHPFPAEKRHNQDHFIKHQYYLICV